MAGPERLGAVFEKSGLTALKFRCNDCGHRGQMDRATALETFGAMATVLRVNRRLRCGRCRSRRCEAWV